jgi:hypothetical protein
MYHFFCGFLSPGLADYELFFSFLFSIKASEDFEDLSAKAGGVAGLGRPSSPFLQETSLILFRKKIDNTAGDPE